MMKLATAALPAIVLGCLMAPAIGQELEVGSKAPKLANCTWIKGDPIDLGKSDGKRITVVEFWATWCGPCVAAVPHLTELQHRFAGGNVRIVGVTRNEPTNTLEIVRNFVEKRGDKMDYDVAFDKDGEVYGAYMDAAGQGGIPTAFVVDTSGRIAWIGHPEGGLGDVLADLVGGKFDIEVAKKLYKIDRRVEEAFVLGDWEAVIKGADEALAVKPDSIDHRMTKFHVYAHQLDGIEEARKCARRALRVAEGDPTRVARVASDILSQSDEFHCNKMAVGALENALKKAHDNSDVRMAYFRALSASGKNKKAMALAVETIGTIKSEPGKLNRFAKMLSAPASQELCGDLALRAVELAIEADPEEPAHYLTKFHILHECKKNKNAATEAGLYAIQLAAGDAAVLNEFAWRLLTDDSTKGQFNELALAAADQLYKAPGGDGWSQLDTIALAKFENGAVDEAIKLERQAIDKCNDVPTKAALVEALARFEQAKD